MVTKEKYFECPKAGEVKLGFLSSFEIPLHIAGTTHAQTVVRCPACNHLHPVRYAGGDFACKPMRQG